MSSNPTFKIYGVLIFCFFSFKVWKGAPSSELSVTFPPNTVTLLSFIKTIPVMNIEAQTPNFSRNIPPTLEQVQAYFNSLQVPASEAEVFYFYYQGMDWCN